MGKFLKKTKGFTLIELLVVIAIIAILVVIVVMAINPAKRIKDANNSSAASNVRSAATLVSTCITKELANSAPTSDVYSTTANKGCGDVTTGGKLASYGTVPPSAVVITAVAGSKLCIYTANGGGDGGISWDSTTGKQTAAGSGVSGCS